MNERHIVILGGGITGLVAAYRLRQWHDTDKLPLRCTLIEQSHRFGGDIETLRTDEYILELGPDSIYTRKPAGVEFIRQIGLTDAMVPVTSGGGTLVWHKGRLQKLPPGVNTGVPTDMGAFAKTGLLTVGGKIRSLADLFLPYVPYPEDIPLGQLLRKRLGNEVVDMIAAPLLAGIHAGDIDRLSLDATMPMWRRLYENHRSLILGAMAMKKKMAAAPASATPPGPIFVNLQNGLEQMVDHLVQLLRDFAELRLGTSAIKVQHTDTGKYTVVIQDGGSTSQLEADAVIVATPAPVAAELLADMDIPAGVQLLKSIRYTHTATVSFGYKKTNATSPIAGSGFLVPRNVGATITACTIVSNKWSNASPLGNLLVRCYVGRDGDEKAVDFDDDRIVQITLNDLKHSIHLTAQPDFINIKRWKNSMPQYDAGHLDRIKRIDQEVGRFPGLALAGGAYHGIGIPDCITDATRAVEQIKQHLL